LTLADHAHNVSALMIGRRRETPQAMLPLAPGLTWTIGLPHVLGINFNLANIWGLPLIIGTSAEFGLNVMLRYLEGRAHGGPLVARSTVTAVALNGVIMTGGFGGLMVASHRGIFSLGLLLTVGTACGVFASLIVLPVALRLLTRQSVRPAESKRTPSARHGIEDRFNAAESRLDGIPAAPDPIREPHHGSRRVAAEDRRLRGWTFRPPSSVDQRGPAATGTRPSRRDLHALRRRRGSGS
jgi:hypothetical protein